MQRGRSLSSPLYFCIAVPEKTGYNTKRNTKNINKAAVYDFSEIERLEQQKLEAENKNGFQPEAESL